MACAVLCPPKGIPFIYDMASAIPEQLVWHPLLGTCLAQRLLRGAERRVIERAAHVVCSGGLGARVCEVSPQAEVTEWRFPVLQQPVDPREVSALAAGPVRPPFRDHSKLGALRLRPESPSRLRAVQTIRGQQLCQVASDARA